jgi:hypothetical protein
MIPSSRAKRGDPRAQGQAGIGWIAAPAAPPRNEQARE